VGGRAWIARVRPFARGTEQELTIIPARRGVVSLCRATVSCGFPFELLHPPGPVRASGEIVVLAGGGRRATDAIAVSHVPP
jgi:uncharacterized protein (DUF58 family)